MPAIAPQIARVILVAGHGLSNVRPGIYDSGAVGCLTVDGQKIEKHEADVVARIADQVESSLWNREDAPVSVIRAPECSAYCLSKHKTSSHLSYVVSYLNDNQIRINGKAGDFILALHLNSSDNHEASGVEVYYSKAAVRGGVRWHQAVTVGIAVSNALGLRNRGIYRSDDSQHSSLAILDSTSAPALLIELGFISNENDLRAVESCGVTAVIEAIKALVSRR